MFYTITFSVAVVALLAFGVFYAFAPLTSYHLKILESQQELGSKVLEKAFRTLSRICLLGTGAIMICSVVGCAIVVADSHTGRWSEFLFAGFFTGLVLLNVLFFESFLCHLPSLPDLGGIDRLLNAKRRSGVAMFLLAVLLTLAHVQFVTSRFGHVSVIGIILFWVLAKTTVETRKLGKQTGVKTPWQVPLVLSAIVLTGIVVQPFLE